ncbi:hypothetical protein [Actinoplanes sp. NPDC049599]|uniref:hypothetical protein n=1 Tax=Actinoplanes sp. NPDC049599 TaxID=3363903 RepID=UPI00378C0521
MVLQGSQPVGRQGHGVPVRQERSNTRSSQRRVALPTVSANPRSYPPITRSTPSLGRAVAGGLGGIARSMLLVVLLVAALVVSAMIIAIGITSVVAALGLDASAGY